MNNKGFTLVELLVSVIILSLVLLIAIPSLGNLSTSIKKNDRDNNIKNIEIAAAKYAFDSGKTLIFVDELITEGYLKGDDDGNIIDNLNKSRLNCYIVKMEKVSDYYKAKFIDENFFEKNGKCDETKLNELSEEVFIEAYTNDTKIENINEWQKGVIKLKAYGNNLNIDCKKDECKWTSTSGANITGKDEIEINVDGVLETQYNFQLTVKNNDNVKKYNKSIKLKIDNEKPVISDIIHYYYTKDITIEANDGKGSGIDGYYVEKRFSQDCLSSNFKFYNNNTFDTYIDPGEYMICVKDKVGNVSFWVEFFEH